MKKFIYLALLLGFSNAYSVEEIEIANNPLAGLLEKPTEMDANKQESKAPIYPPNLYLALSVEFPTAGAAYTNSDSFTAKDLGTEYLGYFDNNKCYKYDFTEHAFIPSSRAIELSSGGKKYLGCNNTVDETEEFSGNVMNFITMSAIDILRYTLTGGNRAVGIGSAKENYENAEKGLNGQGVYLRRTRITSQLWGGYNYGTYKDGDKNDNWWRNIDFTNMKDAIPHLIPHRYIPDVINNNSNYVFSDWAIYNEKNNALNGDIATTNNTLDAGNQNKVMFQSKDFGVIIGRKLNNRVRIASPDKFSIHSDGITDYGQLAVVVLACSPTGNEKDGNGRDSNPEQCLNNKPSGLVQKYLGQVKIAALGYLNVEGILPIGASWDKVNGNYVNGGVLRAPLSFLKNEIDENYSFPVNPLNKAEGNSGVINYLNKFGDISGYKGRDPAAELYYEATRYIRGLPNYGVADYKDNKYTIDDTAKDGFNVIEYKGKYEDDPLILSSGMSDETYRDMRNALIGEGGSSDKAVKVYNTLSKDEQEKYRNAACSVNNILFIGDHYTHYARAIPGFSEFSGTEAEHDKYAHNKVNSGMDALEYTKAVLNAELGRTYDAGNLERGDGGMDWGAGSSHSPPAIAGVAYWMRTNDNRKDLLGEQRATNFMIDVLEKNDAHIHSDIKRKYAANGSYTLYSDSGKEGVTNFYYLAAKYGGFGLKLNDTNTQPDSSSEYSGLKAKPSNNNLHYGQKVLDKETGKYTVTAGGGIGVWKADTTGEFYVMKADYQKCVALNEGETLNEATDTACSVEDESGKAVDGKYVWKDDKSEQKYKDAVTNAAKILKNSTGRFNISTDDMPYNLAPGNSPEAIKASLENMFVTAYKQSSLVEGDMNTAVDTTNFANSTGATAFSDGLLLCSDDENCTTNKTDNAGNTINNRMLNGMYDLSTLSGNVVLSEVYISNGKTTYKQDYTNTLAHSIKRNVSNRELYTSNNNTQVKFVAENIGAMAISDSDFTAEVIDFVNGKSADRFENDVIKGPYNYPNVIGTIVNSNILSIPSFIESSNRIYQPSKTGRVSCKPVVNDRMFGVASNDGIYHLIKMSATGVGLDEIYGYIPRAVLPKLKDYKDGLTHHYINDGISQHMTFCQESKTSGGEDYEFKSIVIGTTGRGGSAVYAIDVTDSTPKLLWEHNSSTLEGLGLTIPAITNSFLGDGTPVLIISSGYYDKESGAASSVSNGHIYVVNALTGNRIENDAFTLGSSAVGSPFAYDHNSDGMLDEIYVGDFAGDVWKISYAYNADTNQHIWSKSKFFDHTTAKVEKGGSIVERPITLAPYAAKKGDDVFVVFATGHNLNQTKDGFSPDAQNYVYGIFDHDYNTESFRTCDVSGTVCSPVNGPSLPLIDNDMGSLIGAKQIGESSNSYSQVTVSESLIEDAAEGYTLDRGKYRGWRMKLASGYTPSFAQILQSRIATFLVSRPATKEECETKFKDQTQNNNSASDSTFTTTEDTSNKKGVRDRLKVPEYKQYGDGVVIDSASYICAISFEEQIQESCLTGTTALIAVELFTGSTYKAKPIFDTTGDNQIYSASDCEGYAAGTCPYQVDEYASVIYIDDFITPNTPYNPIGNAVTVPPPGVGGGSGSSKNIYAACPAGYTYQASSAVCIPINKFGISSFIRNSLREIRR